MKKNKITKREITCKYCSKNNGECTEKCLPEGWDKVPDGMYTAESMQFELTESQVRKLRQWERTKGEKYLGAIGGGYEFRFLPTSIGTFVSVHCWDGTHINLTDYDKL